MTLLDNIDLPIDLPINCPILESIGDMTNYLKEHFFSACFRNPDDYELLDRESDTGVPVATSTAPVSFSSQETFVYSFPERFVPAPADNTVPLLADQEPVRYAGIVDQGPVV